MTHFVEKLSVEDLGGEALEEMAALFAADAGMPTSLTTTKVNDLLDLVLPRGMRKPCLTVPPERIADVLWPSARPSVLPTATDVVSYLEGWHLI